MGVGFRCLAKAIEFMSLAFPHPHELIEQNRRRYHNPSNVEVLTKAKADLNVLESRALDKFVSKSGQALVLGCGGGRETIALAERGWHVVAVDQIQVLVDGVRNRIQDSDLNHSIELQCRDVTQSFSFDHSFDLICLLGGPYNFIPSRRLRIKVLSDCRAYLTPAGVCLLNVWFYSSTSSHQKHLAHKLRKIAAWIFRGNTECEIGDQWQGDSFCHHFSSMEEIIEEIRAAGFKIKGAEEEKGSSILVLEHG